MRWLFVLLLLTGAGVVRADGSDADRNKAREAYQSARQHYNLGEFAEALKDFKEAYRNYEDPSFLFNIGQCERQLGHKQEAVRAYRAYLRNAGEVPNRDEVTKIVAMLDKAIADEASARRQPSQETLPPTGETNRALEPQPQATTLTASAPPPAAKTPVYKKWWLWTAVGVVAAGAAVGLGVGLTRTPAAPTANTDFGTFRY